MTTLLVSYLVCCLVIFLLEAYGLHWRDIRGQLKWTTLLHALVIVPGYWILTAVLLWKEGGLRGFIALGWGLAAVLYLAGVLP